MGRHSKCPICTNNFLSSEYIRLRKEGVKGPAISNLLGLSVGQVDLHRKNCVYRRGLKIKSSINKNGTHKNESSEYILKFSDGSDLKEIKTELEQLEVLREHVQRVMNTGESARDILDCIGELRQISTQITKVRAEERNTGLLEGSAFSDDSEKLLQALADANVSEIWDLLCGNRV